MHSFVNTYIIASIVSCTFLSERVSGTQMEIDYEPRMKSPTAYPVSSPTILRTISPTAYPLDNDVSQVTKTPTAFPTSSPSILPSDSSNTNSQCANKPGKIDIGNNVMKSCENIFQYMSVKRLCKIEVVVDHCPVLCGSCSSPSMKLADSQSRSPTSYPTDKPSIDQIKCPTSVITTTTTTTTTTTSTINKSSLSRVINPTAFPTVGPTSNGKSKPVQSTTKSPTPIQRVRQTTLSTNHPAVTKTVGPTASPTTSNVNEKSKLVQSATKFPNSIPSTVQNIRPTTFSTNHPAVTKTVSPTASPVALNVNKKSKPVQSATKVATQIPSTIQNIRPTGAFSTNHSVVTKAIDSTTTNSTSQPATSTKTNPTITRLLNPTNFPISILSSTESGLEGSFSNNEVMPITTFPVESSMCQKPLSPLGANNDTGVVSDNICRQ
jgi:hypothetical protein